MEMNKDEEKDRHEILENLMGQYKILSDYLHLVNKRLDSLIYLMPSIAFVVFVVLNGEDYKNIANNVYPYIPIFLLFVGGALINSRLNQVFIIKFLKHLERRINSILGQNIMLWDTKYRRISYKWFWYLTAGTAPLFTILLFIYSLVKCAKAFSSRYWGIMAALLYSAIAICFFACSYFGNRSFEKLNSDEGITEALNSVGEEQTKIRTKIERFIAMIIGDTR